MNDNTLHALRRWAESPGADTAEDSLLIPFAYLLSEGDLRNFRADMRTVFSEPNTTDEQLDVEEIIDIIREYAEIAEWAGPLWRFDRHPERPYAIDMPGEFSKTLNICSAAVRRAVEQITNSFLLHNPNGLSSVTSRRVKKLPERNLWQVYLPDGYRLRYFIDDAERTVHFVYFGPHSDSRNDGREDSVRQTVHRRMLERRKQSNDHSG